MLDRKGGADYSEEGEYKQEDAEEQERHFHLDGGLDEGS
jgi:hypothetical protein